MTYLAAELGMAIDLGCDEPGMILQRVETGYWHDFLVDGEPVANPFDLNMLPAGQYRLRDKKYAPENF